MKNRLLFLLMAMLLTFSATAQIDPPEPVYGWLRLCEFSGQVALREAPEPGATVYVMLQADDMVEPLNELQYDVNDNEWRRVRASIWDGWMRTQKTSGTEITVCMSTNNAP